MGFPSKLVILTTAVFILGQVSPQMLSSHNGIRGTFTVPPPRPYLPILFMFGVCLSTDDSQTLLIIIRLKILTIT